MNIPEKVRIGSMDYKVVLTEDVILKNNQQCYGHIGFDTHIIEIDKTLRDIQGQQQTFLHELVHGIVYEFKIDFSDKEESVVDKLADALHQVIRDNPDIISKEKDYIITLDGEIISKKLLDGKRVFNSSPIKDNQINLIIEGENISNLTVPHNKCEGGVCKI